MTKKDLNLLFREILSIIAILFLVQCKPRSNQKTAVESNFNKNTILHQDYTGIKHLGTKPQPGLPSPLVRGNDSTISSSKWKSQKEYLKKMLTYYQYGEMPGRHEFDSLKVEVDSVLYLFGRYDTTAVQKKLSFTLYHQQNHCTFRVGLIVPLKVTGRRPVIIKNANFLFELPEGESHGKKRKRGMIFNWARQRAVEKGYVLCKYLRGDIAADQKDNRKTGIFPLYPHYSMGSIAAWAWANSVIIDWLEKQPYIDSTKIAVTGHSRGGKTALCAGIYDERIKVTIPNASGAGGTASLRYFAGEVNDQLEFIGSNKRYLDYGKGEDAWQTLKYLKEEFPYWWSKHWFRFVDSIKYMPFDAHFNKMLIAPRALLNTMARQNFWTNPYGTYLTYLAAQPVFDAYGVPKFQAIHWRNGGHNQDIEDWKALFDYCDFVFFDKPLSMTYNKSPYPNRYQYDPILQPYLEQFKNFGKIKEK